MSSIDPKALEREVVFKAVRSRGPGGQNVNKVSSATFATWNFRASQLLTPDHKTKIADRLIGFMNKDGEIFVRSDEFRDYTQNKRRCLEKLIRALDRALHVPKPRKATRPTRSSIEKRHHTKRRRGEVKKSRKSPSKFND